MGTTGRDLLAETFWTFWAKRAFGTDVFSEDETAAAVDDAREVAYESDWICVGNGGALRDELVGDVWGGECVTVAIACSNNSAAGGWRLAAGLFFSW